MISVDSFPQSLHDNFKIDYFQKYIISLDQSRQHLFYELHRPDPDPYASPQRLLLVRPSRLFLPGVKFSHLPFMTTEQRKLDRFVFARTKFFRCKMSQLLGVELRLKMVGEINPRANETSNALSAKCRDYFR